MFPGLAALQRELRIMAAASPELTLANMKASMGEASDAMVYKELEMTKKRWLFSALRQFSGYTKFNKHTKEALDSPTSTRRNRILALYETQGKSPSCGSCIELDSRKYSIDFIHCSSSPDRLHNSPLTGSYIPQVVSQCTTTYSTLGLSFRWLAGSPTLSVQHSYVFINASPVSLDRNTTVSPSHQTMPGTRRRSAPDHY